MRRIETHTDVFYTKGMTGLGEKGLSQTLTEMKHTQMYIQSDVSISRSYVRIISTPVA